MKQTTTAEFNGDSSEGIELNWGVIFVHMVDFCMSSHKWENNNENGWESNSMFGSVLWANQIYQLLFLKVYWKLTTYPVYCTE